MLDMNRDREKGECQPSDFDLLSSFFLKIGNDPGPVTIDVDERGNDKNKREEKRCGDSADDQSELATDGHREIHNTIVPGPRQSGVPVDCWY
jgi:hypothetical protein